MAGRASGSQVVTIDTRELRTLIERLRDVEDRKLKAALRKTLKQAADLAVDGIRETVQDGTPDKVAKRWGRKGRSSRAPARVRSTGLRAAIAKSTRASLLKGSAKNGGQVKVVTDQGRMPARYPNMVKAYNSRVFRHPVFADAVNGARDSRTRGFRNLNTARKAAGRSELKSWRWVEQRGQANYFGRGVYGKRDEMMRRLEAAMADVTKQLDNL